ncbi:MAG TPA: tetratricopeptide repeat protein [Blastocatellia bacterium]|nr:tetratricopeptide repeat protein [Blastocatellia bacterium]
MKRPLCTLTLMLCFVVAGHAAQPPKLKPPKLKPGKPIDRQIAGGETESYRLKLAAGQLMRVVVEQKGIDVALALVSSDGRQLVESDLTGIIGALEPLSFEAPASADYQLVIRANGDAAVRGVYQVRLELKAAATEQDRKRLTAERFLNESRKLLAQGQYLDPKLREKLELALTLWRQLNDHYWQAFALNALGLAYYSAAEYNRAIEQYDQALALWKEEKLRPGEATVLNNLGNVYLAQKRNDKARECFEQVLAVRRELHDRAGEGNALNDLGVSYDRLQRYEKAIESFEAALQISRELKDQVSEEHRLNNLGNVYQELSRYDKAAEYREQALSVARQRKDQRKDPAGEAAILSALGFDYERLSRYEKSLEYHQQALAINRELKDRRGEGRNLADIGWGSNRLERYQKGIEYCEQALAIARELKDRNGEAIAVNGLANAYSGLRQYEKAIAYGEQYLDIARESKNQFSEAAALNNLASYYRNLLRFEKSIEYFESALKFCRELKDRQSEAMVLRNLGDLYTSITRLDKAVENYEQALPIYREIRDRQGEAVTLGPLANVYTLLGRPEKSIEYFQLALPINRDFKNNFRVANNLNGIGNAYDALGNYEKAVEMFDQALAVAREHKIRVLEGSILSNLADEYNSLRNHDRAVEYAQQALAVNRETRSRSSETFTVFVLGDAFRAKAQYPQAASHHEQALRLAREIRNRFLEGKALHGLMLDWQAQDKPTLAVFYGKQAVNLYQTIRGEITTLERESQQSFVKSKEETYRTLADLLISQGRLPEAEQVINLLKQEEYFDFIRRDASSAPQSGKAQMTPEEAAMEKRYREIADHIAELGTERSTLVDKKSRTPEEEQRLAKLDADLVVAGNAFQKFLDQLATELGSSGDSSGKIFQLRESQGLMEDLRELGKGTVALYTVVGNDRYRVILTTADFQRGFEYAIKGSELNRKVLDFREYLQNPKLDPLPLAQELYKILIGPVAKDLQAANAQTVMWSLDGVLRYLPVSALNDGKQYLVERYRSVVFTPASQARLKDAPARNWDALGLGVSKAHGERIPALPGVVDEMRGIIRDESRRDESGARDKSGRDESGSDVSGAKAAAPGKQQGVLPGVVKLDEQFTEDAMLAELRRRHKVVHIASHFQFEPGNETNSALLLGDGTFLSLAQIKSLPNVFSGVDLLTLSACNTATGSSGANGKEVEGFGVLAQRQGAKAVVATLWPVFDTSTKLLMEDFYRLREAGQDITKAEALRQAQLRLLRGETPSEGPAPKGGPAAKVTTPDQQIVPDRQIVHEDIPQTPNKPRFTPDPKKPYAHPYYWAPFILIGNWK